MTAPAAATTLLEVPASTFAEHFGRSPFTVRHHVGAEHPLLTRAALTERAADWPQNWLEHHLADVPFVLPTGRTEQLDLGVDAIMRDIDENGCWLVLWELEHSPRYEKLLDECLDPVDARVGNREGGMTRRGMNALVASPGAVAPAHFDMHHNFLLQIDGTKDVMIGSFSDAAIAQREVDKYYDEHNNNLRLLPDVVQTFRLTPGDGLYIPPFAFHWVKGGADVSIGISCGFRTRRTEQMNLAHQYNARLRRYGLRPAPAGRSVPRDRVKATAFTSARRARREVAAALARAKHWRGRITADRA
jgi:hypothetical protein